MDWLKSRHEWHYNLIRLMPRAKSKNSSVKASIRAADKILVRVFGNPQWEGGDAVEALVGCILSQATTDAQSAAAYNALIAKYPTWEKLRAARASDIARVIQPARGEINLDFLNDMRAADARKWLMQIHGVGPKTASIVLLFAQKRNVFPVDTHVHRVTQRLGWIPENTSAAQAHKLLEALIPPRRYYAMHINLIRLGREICRAQKPRCEICPLNALCAYYQNLK